MFETAGKIQIHGSRLTYACSEFAGGVTSEATNRSIDCLVSDDQSVPRSVISTLIDVLTPVAVISLFVLFWLVVKIKNKMDLLFLMKRSVLSAVAVFYISYISVTQTLVDILNCIEVHDSTDVMIEATSDYWAVDTSLKCYQGSHATLAGAVGWPFLMLFSLGYPVAMACVILWNVKEEVREGWIYDVAGFMYRSYSKRFVYWESVIMLRKALLAVVVVFAYPLGGRLQAVLCALVLVMALYLQTVCLPYCTEFSDLNVMEGVSLFASLITFVSSMLFYEDSVPEDARIAASTVLLMCNLSLFFCFVLFFLRFGSEYLRAALDLRGISFVSELGTFHVLKVYVMDHLGLRNICDRIFHCLTYHKHANFEA